MPNGQHVLHLRLEFDVTDEGALRQLMSELFSSDLARRTRNPAAMVLARTAREAIRELPGIMLRRLSADWDDHGSEEETDQRP